MASAGSTLIGSLSPQAGPTQPIRFEGHLEIKLKHGGNKVRGGARGGRFRADSHVCPGALGGGVCCPGRRSPQPVLRPSGGCSGSSRPQTLSSSERLGAPADAAAASTEHLQVAPHPHHREPLQGEPALQEEGEHLQTNVSVQHSHNTLAAPWVYSQSVCVCVCLRLQDGSQYLFSASNREVQMMWVEKLQSCGVNCEDSG